MSSLRLLTYNGLDEQEARYSFKSDSIVLPVAIDEGLLAIVLPEGQIFPMWITPGVTDYFLELSAQLPAPKITGSPLTEKLYHEMAVFGHLSQRRTALADAQRGLADTARLKKLIIEEQEALGNEADSMLTYWQSRLHTDPVAAMLWGNRILPEEAAALSQQGQDALAKTRLLRFVSEHYALIAKTDILRNLVVQYLGITEAAGYPKGSPGYEERTRADVQAWAAALKGKYTQAEVTNHIIDIFLHRSMWTLCDTLMKNNPDAWCPPAGKAASPQKWCTACWKQAGNDRLTSMDPTDGKSLVAVYDMSCPAAAMEFLLMRRQLQEGYRLPVPAGFVLTSQDLQAFKEAWAGMPADAYYYAGREGSITPFSEGVPAYYSIEGQQRKYLGRSYRDVIAYFEQTGNTK